MKSQDNQGVTESRKTCKVQYRMFIVKIAEGPLIVSFVGKEIKIQLLVSLILYAAQTDSARITEHELGSLNGGRTERL